MTRDLDSEPRLTRDSPPSPSRDRIEVEHHRVFNIVLGFGNQDAGKVDAVHLGGADGTSSSWAPAPGRSVSVDVDLVR